MWKSWGFRTVGCSGGRRNQRGMMTKTRGRGGGSRWRPFVPFRMNLHGIDINWDNNENGLY